MASYEGQRPQQEHSPLDGIIDFLGIGHIFLDA
jgi:hypothetical protein